MQFNIDLLDGQPPVSMSMNDVNADRLRIFLDECFELGNQVAALQDELYDTKQKLLHYEELHPELKSVTVRNEM